MKTILPITMLILLLGLSFYQQAIAKKPRGKITQEEREYAISFLKETEAALLKTLESIDDEVFDYSVTEEKWSVREHLEHLIITEQAAFQNLRESLLNSERKANMDLRSQDPFILIRVTDLTKKAKTIKPFEPTGSFTDRSEMIRLFKENRSKMIEYLEKTSDELRYYSGMTPVGEADAYQHFLIIAAHGLRHSFHMENILQEYDLARN